MKYKLELTKLQLTAVHQVLLSYAIEIMPDDDWANPKELEDLKLLNEVLSKIEELH
jgi:hypothetical protein